MCVCFWLRKMYHHLLCRVTHIHRPSSPSLASRWYESRHLLVINRYCYPNIVVFLLWTRWSAIRPLHDMNSIQYPNFFRFIPKYSSSFFGVWGIVHFLRIMIVRHLISYVLIKLDEQKAYSTTLRYNAVTQPQSRIFVCVNKRQRHHHHHHGGCIQFHPTHMQHIELISYIHRN